MPSIPHKLTKSHSPSNGYCHIKSQETIPDISTTQKQFEQYGICQLVRLTDHCEHFAHRLRICPSDCVSSCPQQPVELQFRQKFLIFSLINWNTVLEAENGVDHGRTNLKRFQCLLYN